MNRQPFRKRLLKWRPVLLCVLALALPLVRSWHRQAYFQERLAGSFAQRATSAEQQAAELFDMFTAGALGPVTIVDFDWPYYFAAALFALVAARFWWIYRPASRADLSARRR